MDGSRSRCGLGDCDPGQVCCHTTTSGQHDLCLSSDPAKISCAFHNSGIEHNQTLQCPADRLVCCRAGDALYYCPARPGACEEGDMPLPPITCAD